MVGRGFFMKFLAFCFCFFPFFAWGENCPYPEKPVVNVFLQASEPVYSHAYSMEEFALFSQENKIESFSNHNADLRERGVTFFKLQSDLTLETEAKRYKNGFCIYPKTLTIKIGFPKMIVLIGKKYKKTSCAYQEILKHENTHVLINYKTLEEFLPHLKEAQEKIMKTQKGTFTRNLFYENSIKRKLTKNFMEKNTSFLSFLKSTLQKRNGKIDTLQSYQELQNRCTDWD